jgi:hypothetical protein
MSDCIGLIVFRQVFTISEIFKMKVVNLNEICIFCLSLYHAHTRTCTRPHTHTHTHTLSLSLSLYDEALYDEAFRRKSLDFNNVSFIVYSGKYTGTIWTKIKFANFWCEPPLPNPGYEVGRIDGYTDITTSPLPSFVQGTQGKPWTESYPSSFCKWCCLRCLCGRNETDRKRSCVWYDISCLLTLTTTNKSVIKNFQ